MQPTMVIADVCRDSGGGESRHGPLRLSLDQLARHLAAAQLLGLESPVRETDVAPRVGFADTGYGLPTSADIAAIQLFAEAEGLFLDPVYTCKAASALIEDVANGKLSSTDRVVFWHTGGTPALFPYRGALVAGVAQAESAGTGVMHPDRGLV